MYQVVSTTFAIVLLSELIGDKTIYSVSVLTARYRPLPILLGMLPAFMLKVLVAVLFGGLLTRLPLKFVTILNEATFFLLALFLGLEKSESNPEKKTIPRFAVTASFAAFSAIFFTEWFDPGQIAAATLAAHYRAPGAVWLGASLALFTKGILAVLLGMGLRKHVPVRWVRYGAVCMALVLGLVSLYSK